MKRMSKLACAAALMTGAGGVVLVAPAQAKKEDKAAAAGRPSYSPEFIKAAGPAQTAIKASDITAATPAVAAAEAAAKTDDDHYAASVMRVQLEAAKLKAAPAGTPTDESPLKAPLEALIANPKTPADQRGQFAYQRGAIAFNSGQNADAVKYFTQAKQLGYSDPQLAMALVKAKIDSGDIAGGTADLDAAIKQSEASGQKAPEDYYRYALGQNVKAKNKPQSVDWLKRWVSAYPTAKNWHDALYIYGLQGTQSLTTLDKNQTVDVFRLMRQTKSLDQYGYEEYAQKVLDSGLPDEAKTVITEGRASGKVPATGGNGAGILADANKGISNEGSLASLSTKAKAGASGNLAAQTADAYLGKGDYTSAIPLYRTALEKGVGPRADEVNTHLGIALALAGDKAAAKTAFAAVTGPTRVDIAQFWTLWLDHPPMA